MGSLPIVLNDSTVMLSLKTVQGFFLASSSIRKNLIFLLNFLVIS